MRKSKKIAIIVGIGVIVAAIAVAVSFFIDWKYLILGIGGLGGATSLADEFLKNKEAESKEAIKKLEEESKKIEENIKNNEEILNGKSKDMSDNDILNGLNNSK